MKSWLWPVMQSSQTLRPYRSSADRISNHDGRRNLSSKDKVHERTLNGVRNVTCKKWTRSYQPAGPANALDRANHISRGCCALQITRTTTLLTFSSPLTHTCMYESIVQLVAANEVGGVINAYPCFVYHARMTNDVRLARKRRHDA